jgi:hypothetical protein
MGRGGCWGRLARANGQIQGLPRIGTDFRNRRRADGFRETLRANRFLPSRLMEEPVAFGCRTMDALSFRTDRSGR